MFAAIDCGTGIGMVLAHMPKFEPGAAPAPGCTLAGPTDALFYDLHR